MPDGRDDQCSATCRSGSRCRGRARPGSSFCPLHDPSLADARQAGRRAGAATRNRQAAVLADSPDLPLKTAADVTEALATTFNDVRTGRLDCRVGNCLGVLGSALLRALEADEVRQRLERNEERLAALEKAARERAGTNGRFPR